MVERNWAHHLCPLDHSTSISGTVTRLNKMTLAHASLRKGDFPRMEMRMSQGDISGFLTF